MIRTEDEYNTAVEFIDGEPGFYNYELSSRMDSFEHNLYLQDAEYFLDVLYEKLRSLEELIEYLDYYGESRVDEIEKLLAEKEALLELTLSVPADNGSSAVNLTFKQNTAISDRDGAIIPIIPFKPLTAFSVDTDIRKIISIDKETDVIPASDNTRSCIDDGIYMSYYNLDYPMEITEYLHIEIPSAAGIDFAEFEPINCKAQYMGTDDNGKAVIKLTASDMSKEKENFNYSEYLGSNLDNLRKTVLNRSPGEHIANVQKLLAEAKNTDLGKEYIDLVKKYLATESANKEKDELYADKYSY